MLGNKVIVTYSIQQTCSSKNIPVVRIDKM